MIKSGDTGTIFVITCVIVIGQASLLAQQTKTIATYNHMQQLLLTTKGVGTILPNNLTGISWLKKTAPARNANLLKQRIKSKIKNSAVPVL